MLSHVHQCHKCVFFFFCIDSVSWVRYSKNVHKSIFYNLYKYATSALYIRDNDNCKTPERNHTAYICLPTAMHLCTTNTARFHYSTRMKQGAKCKVIYTRIENSQLNHDIICTNSVWRLQARRKIPLSSRNSGNNCRATRIHKSIKYSEKRVIVL